MQLCRLLRTYRLRQSLPTLQSQPHLPTPHMMPLIKHNPTNLIIMINLSQYHQYTVRYTRSLNTLCQVMLITVNTVDKYGQLILDDHVINSL